MATFRVVIGGKVRPGFDSGTACERLAKLLQERDEVATRLLAGRPVVVKRGVDQATASRYVAALTEIGLAARSEQEALESEPRGVQAGAAAATSSVNAGASSSSFVPSDAGYIATEKGPGWEYRYFFQILTDEVERSSHLKRSPPLGSRVSLPFGATHTWFIARQDALLRLIQGIEAVVRDEKSAAFGPPGQAGDSAAIALMARKIATAYRQCIEWVHSVRSADVNASWREITYELAMVGEDQLKAIEDYAPDSLRKLDEALPITSAVHRTLDLILTFPRVRDRLSAAIERLQIAVLREEVTEVTPLVSRAYAGYVYILSNPSLGTELKIGRTFRNPRDRAQELSAATGVPRPFVLAFDAYVEDCVRAEAYVHASLANGGYRVADNREFFNVDLSTAIAAVLEAQQFVATTQHDEEPENEGDEAAIALAQPAVNRLPVQMYKPSAADRRMARGVLRSLMKKR